MSQNNDGDNSNNSSLLPAPLYITIGPPCAGKSTFLLQQQQQQHSSSNDDENSQIRDIALDDQPGVYRALPAVYFTSDNLEQEFPDRDDRKLLLQEHVANQSILERIQAPDQAELRCLCRYVDGKLSFGEFKDVLHQIHNNSSINGTDGNQTTTDLAQLVLNALEVCQTNNNSNLIALPQTVDLFCRQALFMRLPENNFTSAIDMAHQVFQKAPLNQPCAWGNTNLRPTDYQVALQIAAQQGRPVHFVVFDARSNMSSASQSLLEDDESLFDLPNAGLEELMQRNLERFFATGRYIPSNVLADMMQRSQDLLLQIMGKSNQLIISTPLSKSEIQRQFALLAHYDRLANGTVVALAVNASRKRRWPASNNNIRRHPYQSRHPSNGSGFGGLSQQRHRNATHLRHPRARNVNLAGRSHGRGHQQHPWCNGRGGYAARNNASSRSTSSSWRAGTWRNDSPTGARRNYENK